MLNKTNVLTGLGCIFAGVAALHADYEKSVRGEIVELEFGEICAVQQVNNLQGNVVELSNDTPLMFTDSGSVKYIYTSTKPETQVDNEVHGIVYEQINKEFQIDNDNCEGPIPVRAKIITDSPDTRDVYLTSLFLQNALDPSIDVGDTVQFNYNIDAWNEFTGILGSKSPVIPTGMN